MTQHNRPPKLYVTSDLLEMAHDEGITGATAHTSAHEVIQRGSQGALRGLSVSRLVLHTSAEVEDPQLQIFRVDTHEPTTDRFQVSRRPGTHPTDFIKAGLPEAHSLIVPIKEFDATATAWSLHNAAARYGQDLGLPRAGESELRAPTEGFGIPALDGALDTALHLLGGSVSKAQPANRRERPEDLASQLKDRLNPLIGRTVDAIRAVQDLPGRDKTPDQPQPSILQLTPAEMAGIVAEQPPIFFHTNLQ